jgi:hypothetical protein
MPLYMQLLEKYGLKRELLSSRSGYPALDSSLLKAGLLASLALRVNLRLFKALRALVPLREDDDSLLNVECCLALQC